MNAKTIINRIKKIQQIPQKTDPWYETKQHIVTATDVPVIMGCSPFKTPRDLYLEKCSPNGDVFVNNAIQWGIDHEPLAKREIQKSVDHFLEIGLGVHPEYSSIGASPDGLVIIGSEIWLVEIKCPFNRQGTQSIPFHYWLQIQTQLFVWKRLLEEKQLTLCGCIYYEYAFNPTSVYKQNIVYDEKYFIGQVLPETLFFQSCLERYGTQPKTKRSRSQTWKFDQIYEGYLKQKSQPHYQTQYRHSVDHDHLLDWLDLYGEKNHFTKDMIKSDKKTHDFKRLVYAHLKRLQSDYVDINETHNGLESHNYKGFARWMLIQTLTALQRKTPLIFNGVLYDIETGVVGHYDLIIRVDCFKRIFVNRPLETSAQYTFIQLKANHLHLSKDGLYLLNTTHGHQNLKMENTHLHTIKGPEWTACSFVLGACTSNRKGQEFNAMRSLVIIDHIERDVDYLKKMEKCRVFLTELRTAGQNWSIDPPNRCELFPNMKNHHDSPWQTTKKQLATKNKEVTLVWQLGPKDRHSWTMWDEIKPHRLDLNEHYLMCVKSILKSNKRGIVIHPNEITIERQPIEFYVDFEFIGGIVDLTNFPICQPMNYLYMIGCLSVNNMNGQKVYNNYLINRLNREQEHIMIVRWLKDMLTFNQQQHEMTIYHWGTAEKTQIEKHLDPQISLDLQLIDVCRILNQAEMGFPWCFNYGLKDVASSLYRLGLIKTTWKEDGISGDKTVSIILEAEHSCQKGVCTRLCDITQTRELIDYNYVDCKSIEEIVDYLRM
jgi:putative phage-type endonuclease